MDLDREKELVELAKEDRHYFGLLFDKYYPAIFNYTLKRTADAAAATDITAETFYKALVNIDKFQWRDISISSWFYKIATNELRMYFRKNKYRPASLDHLYENGWEPTDEHDFREEILDAQDKLENHQEFLRAQALLSSMPLKYREVISLRFGENKKLSEIAAILGKKEGTVKSLLSRGLKQLRQRLDQERSQPSGQPDIIDSEGRTILVKPLEQYED